MLNYPDRPAGIPPCSRLYMIRQHACKGGVEHTEPARSEVLAAENRAI